MEERVLQNPRIASWKQVRADYLPHVSGRYHVRLLAMTRLGILPIEIETGRWEGVEKTERFCKFDQCNGKIGDTYHFLRECSGLKTQAIASIWRCPGGLNPGVWWRETAHLYLSNGGVRRVLQRTSITVATSYFKQRWETHGIASSMNTHYDPHFSIQELWRRTIWPRRSSRTGRSERKLPTRVGVCGVC